MPVPLLNEYVENLPRLTAEESLQAAERVAVGSGSLKKGKGRQIAGQWQRATGRTRHVLKPSSKEAYVAQMAMQGIAVKKVRISGPIEGLSDG